MEKIPTYTEITDKELNIYRVMPELENVVELGWYGDHKRHHLEETGMDCIGDEVRKKRKNDGGQESTGKENITLGSLSLAQYEDIKKRSESLLQHKKSMRRRRRLGRKWRWNWR